jgi:hypothetical protein
VTFAVIYHVLRNFHALSPTTNGTSTFSRFSGWCQARQGAFALQLPQTLLFLLEHHAIANVIG